MTKNNGTENAYIDSYPVGNMWPTTMKYIPITFIESTQGMREIEFLETDDIAIRINDKKYLYLSKAIRQTKLKKISLNEKNMLSL